MNPRTILLLSLQALFLFGVPAFAQENASTLYLQAAKALTVDCPSSSNFNFPDYPPFGPDWDRLEASAWIKNAQARQLAHQASACRSANWPTDSLYLNQCRAIANELGDAAMYQHLKGQDASAGALIVDLLNLSKFVREIPAGKKAPSTVSFLVAGGIDGLASYRVMMIDSQIKLTTDPANKTDMQMVAARALINQLLEQVDARDQTGEFFNADGSPRFLPQREKTLSRIIETFNRCNAGRTMAAMSLACHMFLFDQQHWPDSLADLSPAYIKKIPLDPWGNGKQTFGYTLLEAGLPDGSDRPLIYCRCLSHGSLFYRTDEPHYIFYSMPNGEPTGGQFRDVAGWVPSVQPPDRPTTKPLE